MTRQDFLYSATLDYLKDAVHTHCAAEFLAITDRCTTDATAALQAHQLLATHGLYSSTLDRDEVAAASLATLALVRWVRLQEEPTTIH